jgi:hypothetical protein
MDRGQHGPPRREVWSWYHPSSKSILPSRQPAAQFIDNLKLSLLTRSSRFFQRMYYCKRTVSIEPTTLVAGKGATCEYCSRVFQKGLLIDWCCHPYAAALAQFL